MQDKPKNSGPVVGFLGLLVTTFVVGFAYLMLKEILGTALLFTIIIVGLTLTGVSVWYARQKAHKQWLAENRHIIEGRNRRNRRTNEESNE